jgi:PAS domain S-box-containing protein
MRTDHTHPAVLARKLASWAALLSVVVGAMVLVGWTFDIVTLKSVLPGWVAMKANTAVCFILTGIALLLTARPPATFNPERSGRSFGYGNRTAYPLRVQFSTLLFRLARLCGLLVGLIGLLSLGEYVFGWNPGIDQWLFIEPNGTVGTSYPGRMAPETALSFVLLAAALWITGSSHQTRWTALASVSLGLLVTTLALAAMLSYPTPGLGAYGWFGLTIMAMHTSLLFAMLGMAVIAISWQPDVLQWSLSRNTTAAFACGMAVLVLIGFNTNRSQFWLGETNRKIAYSEEAQDYIENILIEIIDAQTYTRGYVITGDEQFKTHYLEAKANSNVNLDALRKLTASNPHQQQQFARIEVQAKAQLQWFQQVIDARQTSMTDAIRNNMIRYGEGLLDNFRITYDQIKSEHHQLIQQLKQESESMSRFSYLIIFIGTFTSLMIFLAVIFRLNFAVNERMQMELALAAKETRLRTLVGTIPDMIWLKDENGVYVSCNPMFERFYGAKEADIVGKTDYDFVDKELADFFREHDRIAMAANKPSIEPEAWVVFADDGHRALLEAIKTPMYDPGGKLVGVLGIARDITERKLAEEDLRKSEAEFRTLAEAMPQIVWITRADGWNIYFNQQWMDYTGLTLEESLGHGWNKPFHPDDQQRTWDAWQLAVTGRGIYSIESRLRRADGIYRWWLVRGVPLLDADGNILKWFGTCTDINDIKMAVQEISRINLELRESERRFSDMLENVELVSVMRDSEERITYCNEFLLRLTGWKYEEIIGRNWVELFVPPEIAKQKKKVFAELILNKPEARHYESEILTRSGERRLIRWNHSVLRSGDGDVIGTASIGEDITERKQTEVKQAEQIEELRRWHEVTSGREERILDLKHEVNDLLGKTGKHPRYPSAESQDPIEE